MQNIFIQDMHTVSSEIVFSFWGFGGVLFWIVFPLHIYPREKEDFPPGGARTFEEFLSVKKFPTFCPSGLW